MESGTILYIYCVAFAFYLLAENSLEILNLTWVSKNAATIPAQFKPHIDPTTYQSSIRYTQAKAKFGIFAGLYSSLIAFLLLASGFLAEIEAWLRPHFSSETHLGVVYLVLVGFLFSLISLPVSLYSTFKLEQFFGFNKTNFRTWCSDLVKGAGLSLVLMVPLLFALLWCMQVAGNSWWLWAFALLAIFQVLVMYLFPVLIAPLFNKFTPLADGGLKEKIEAISKRLEFATTGIFLMDGSKRSAHANAYFTGFGGKKRVVLFDTLIQNLTEEQVLAVLAHEIGHEKRGHIKKLIAFSMCSSLLGFWILSLMLPWTELYVAFGFSSPSYHAGLLIFMMASQPFTWFLSPLNSLLSRKYEYQADDFARRACGSSDPLIGGLVALSKKSLSNFNPHPWYSFFHYSHPTLGDRISAMQAAESGGAK